jgi:hypothetical protein
VEQLLKFAGSELVARPIGNLHPVSGSLELAGFGDSNYRAYSMRLVAATVF